ncbi:ABC transporter permease [Rhodococcus sp. NPDC060176]|uniref:ABC transporter permease n=1 Tax=Rhodococcus sp. NPDC060176 TaxID=3347062 RepID=UPI0036696342
MTTTDVSRDTTTPPSDPETTPNKVRRNRIPYGLLSIVAGLLVWEALVRVLQPSRLIIVAPSEILARLFDMIVSGEIWPDLSVSLQGFAVGYILAAAVAIPLGLAIGASTLLYKLANPWVNALYATPIIGLAPLFIIIFGFGLTSKIAVVIALVIFPILINTVSGARAVGIDHKELAVVYKANRFETFTRVLFPGSTPFILTGLRLAVGRGLIGVVVADLFGASKGLGLNLQRSAQAFNTVDIFAVTLLLAFLGIASSAALEYFERRAYRGVKP